jgi:DHA1 family multidrug resistance protein-like MFS transporter
VKPSGSWYQRNKVLIWVCALIGVNQLGFGSIVPVVPLYALAFDVPQSAIGMTIAVYGLARFLLGVPCAKLADVAGRRVTLALGGLVTAGGSLLCGLAPTYETFLAARFIAGAGAALVLTGCQIVLVDISPPDRRGRTMAIFSGVFSFAVGLGPLPGGILAANFGLATPFFVFAALALIAGSFGWFMVPETKDLRLGTRSGPAKPLPSFTTQIRILTSQRGFLLISLLSFCTFAARTGGLFNVIPILGQERLGLTTAQIGLGLGIVSVVGLVLAYPTGWLADRFGRKPVIVPSTLFNGLSFVFFLLAPDYTWFLVGCLAWAISSGLSGAAPSAYAADMAPPGMAAAAMGAYRTLSELGYVVGPLLLGLIADLFGPNAALASIAGALALVALTFALFAPETHRRPARA